MRKIAKEKRMKGKLNFLCFRSLQSFSREISVSLFAGFAEMYAHVVNCAKVTVVFKGKDKKKTEKKLVNLSSLRLPFSVTSSLSPSRFHSYSMRLKKPCHHALCVELIRVLYRRTEEIFGCVR